MSSRLDLSASLKSMPCAIFSLVLSIMPFFSISIASMLTAAPTAAPPAVGSDIIFPVPEGSIAGITCPTLANACKISFLVILKLFK